ncbi:MAG: hypothetical protein HOK41_10940 [Nitrospina sp.]|nr:hypothetical protein [Nitrospina sp.]MBT6716546.1 hypothetical protein [Nitrospina sp.]
MKVSKHLFAALLVLFLIPIAWVFAGPEPAKVPVKQETVGKAKAKPVAKIIKKQAKAGKKKKQPQGIVVGKNLKVGMNLDQAITLLGVPKKIKVKRGTEPSLDSLSIEFAKHGVVIHTLNEKKKIEVIELLPTFKGQFANGIKVGDKVPTLIKKYGVPQSMSASLARYPDKGLYFSLKENVLVSVWIFVKNSKILSHQLFKTS